MRFVDFQMNQYNNSRYESKLLFEGLILSIISHDCKKRKTDRSSNDDLNTTITKKKFKKGIADQIIKTINIKIITPDQILK